ncbi:MAG: helix-turn-helix domain-containing protein [Alphaproteobacteria bacterium]
MPETSAIIELKKIMKKHIINQLQLSQRSFIPQSKLSELLNNKRRFSPEMDIKLCKVFNLKTSHFLLIQMKDEITSSQNKHKETIKKILPL